MNTNLDASSAKVWNNVSEGENIAKMDLRYRIIIGYTNCIYMARFSIVPTKIGLKGKEVKRKGNWYNIASPFLNCWTCWLIYIQQVKCLAVFLNNTLLVNIAWFKCNSYARKIIWSIWVHNCKRASWLMCVRHYWKWTYPVTPPFSK